MCRDDERCELIRWRFYDVNDSCRFLYELSGRLQASGKNVGGAPQTFVTISTPQHTLPPDAPEQFATFGLNHTHLYISLTHLCLTCQSLTLITLDGIPTEQPTVYLL